MKTPFARIAAVDLGWIGCLMVVATGCGGNPAPPVGVTVVGTVFKSGQPLKAENLPPGEIAAEVVFVPLDPGGIKESQALKVDGTFKEVGWEKGIKPGKYRLAVHYHLHGRGRPDGLEGRFSEQKSPITVVIPPDKVGGTFDLKTIELDDYKSK